jgi:hypothetical protein
VRGGAQTFVIGPGKLYNSRDMALVIAQ